MRPMKSLFGKKSSLRSLTRPLRKRLRLWTSLRLAAAKRSTITAKIVCITGSSGKSTTTLLLSKFLMSRYATREQLYRNTLPSCIETMQQASRKDEFIVVETAASFVGSVAQMAGLLKPDVAVVTMVAVEHRSVFKSLENVAKEKGALVEAIAEGGFAVLNADDEQVMKMAERTKQRIVTFGYKEDADYRVVELSLSASGTLDLAIRSAHGTHRLATQLLGVQFWPSVAAAFAVAVESGIDPETIAELVPDIRTGRNRCEPYPVRDGPTFIVDTVKAPIHTMEAAFETIRALEAPRKRIVLGMIADHPGNSNSAYRKAYRWAAANADQVIFVGEHAHRHKASEEDIAAGRIVEKDTVEDVYAFLRDTAIPGEIILLKSAAGAHLERLALAFRHDVKCWKERCGRSLTCQVCALYEYPFEQHEEIGDPKRLAARGRGGDNR